MKEYIKQIVPPILLALYRKFRPRYGFFGVLTDYPEVALEDPWLDTDWIAAAAIWWGYGNDDLADALGCGHFASRYQELLFQVCQLKIFIKGEKTAGELFSGCLS